MLLCIVKGIKLYLEPQHITGRQCMLYCNVLYCTVKKNLYNNIKKKLNTKIQIFEKLRNSDDRYNFWDAGNLVWQFKHSQCKKKHESY